MADEPEIKSRNTSPPDMQTARMTMLRSGELPWKRPDARALYKDKNLRGLSGRGAKRGRRRR